MPTERRSQSVKAKVKKGKDKDRGREEAQYRCKFGIEAALKPKKVSWTLGHSLPMGFHPTARQMISLSFQLTPSVSGNRFNENLKCEFRELRIERNGSECVTSATKPQPPPNPNAEIRIS